MATIVAGPSVAPVIIKASVVSIMVGISMMSLIGRYIKSMPPFRDHKRCLMVILMIWNSLPGQIT